MKYIGIDPGVSGGIAWTSKDGPGAEPMPDTDRGILDLLSGHARDAVAVLEFVRSSPQMGVASAFTFGAGYGGLKMALSALGIPYIEVAPLKWQKALGCVSPPKPSRAFLTAKERSARQREHKHQVKALAEQLFPGLPVTLATADALLLAAFCARQDWRGVRPNAA